MHQRAITRRRTGRHEHVCTVPGEPASDELFERVLRLAIALHDSHGACVRSRRLDAKIFDISKSQRHASHDQLLGLLPRSLLLFFPRRRRRLYSEVTILWRCKNGYQCKCAQTHQRYRVGYSVHETVDCWAPTNDPDDLDSGYDCTHTDCIKLDDPKKNKQENIADGEGAIIFGSVMIAISGWAWFKFMRPDWTC